MNHENPYTLTMQTTAAHAWDEGFEAGRIAERGRLAGEVTDIIDRLAAEAGSKRARTSQLHRIVTLDVAIEAVREGAAAGVAASEERIRRAEETRENANQASVRVELENERLKARLVAGEKSGNPYRGHDCIGDDCQGCAYEAGWDEGAEKRWVREEGWHKIRDVLIEADAIDADGLYPGWSADLTDEIVAALLSGEPEA